MEKANEKQTSRVHISVYEFGSPQPWSLEKTQVYVEKCRKELDKGYHIYLNIRRVWAQKPFLNADKEEE